MAPPILETPLTYTVSPALEHYQVLVENYLAEIQHTHLVGAAVVIRNGRVLLIQRAAQDFVPNTWEVPGGSADHGETIVEGAARELWEESGLRASALVALVDECEFGEPGTWKKLTFLVDVEGTEGDRLHVKLDAEEHQAFVWATEDQVRADRCDDVKLNWTFPNMKDGILKAFERVNKKLDSSQT